MEDYQIITEKDKEGKVIKATVKMKESQKPKKLTNNSKSNDKL